VTQEQCHVQRHEKWHEWLNFTLSWAFKFKTRVLVEAAASLTSGLCYTGQVTQSDSCHTVRQLHLTAKEEGSDRVKKILLDRSSSLKSGDSKGMTSSSNRDSEVSQGNTSYLLAYSAERLSSPVLTLSRPQRCEFLLAAVLQLGPSACRQASSHEKPVRQPCVPDAVGDTQPNTLSHALLSVSKLRSHRLLKFKV
jgi:hypothetical protein